MYVSFRIFVGPFCTSISIRFCFFFLLISSGIASWIWKAVFTEGVDQKKPTPVDRATGGILRIKRRLFMKSTTRYFMSVLTKKHICQTEKKECDRLFSSGRQRRRCCGCLFGSVRIYGTTAIETILLQYFHYTCDIKQLYTNSLTSELEKN